MSSLKITDELESQICSIESGAIRQNEPQNYGKLDSPSTSKKECLGFYLYGIGSKPFSAAILLVCLPILIKKMGIAIAYNLDKVSKCTNPIKDLHCVININLGLELYIDVESVCFYVVSLGVCLQTLVLGGLGPVGKFKNFKKTLLLMFSFVGSITVISFAFLKESSFWAGVSLAVVGTVCHGASNVYYYSYLTVLTDNSNQVITSKSLLNSKIISHDQYFSKREQVANRISAKGVGYSYIAVVIMFVSFVLIVKKELPLGNLQYACAFAGLWWFAFALVSLLFFEDRKENCFPKEESYFTYSYKELYKTFKTATSCPNTFMLLLAWFLFSDALSTAISLSVLISQKELQLGELKLMAISILAPISASIGIFIVKYIQIRIGVSTKTMITTCNVFYMFLALYECVGIFTDKIGLQNESEVYIITICYGALLGASQSYYRVQFNELFPSGKEHEFYTLFLLSSYGSTWFGPLFVGLLNDVTKNIRLGFVLIVIMLLICLILVVFLKNKTRENTKQTR